MADQYTVTSESTKTAPTTSSEEQKKEAVIAPDAPGKNDVPQGSAVEAKESTNGTNDTKTVVDTHVSEPATKTQDTKMKDASETGAPVADIAPTAPETVEKSAVNNVAANAPATPTTASKKPNGNTSTKKKSAGVPEHKSKKLNKKKSKAELKLNLHCQPGELFLARMKGHAPWPSIICDEEILPASLLNSRPVTTALPDGTFKRPDYAPGGKREGERTFPIMFLFTNEFAWLPNVDLTPITPDECKDVDQKGKSKALISAYGVAAEDHDLQYYKMMLADHQAAVQEDLDRQAAKEAEKAAAKAAKAEGKKAKRKSTAKVDEDDDEMDVDEDGETSKPKSKKRKKDADAEDDAEEKPAKTPKLKLNGPKTPSTDKKAAAKPKSSSKKAAAKKDSDEDMADAPAAEASLTPAELKEKKEKEIRYYRHKLQKGLLSRDDAPGDEEVETASGYLQKLETYPGLEGEIIRSTKIHKVLRAIIRLTSIPKDEEYKLKQRSSDLLQKWNTILGTDGSADASHEAPVESVETKIETEQEKKPEVEPAAAKPVDEKKDESESKTAPAVPETKVNGTSALSNTAAEPQTETSKPAEPATEKPTEAAPAKPSEPEKTSQPEAPKTDAAPAQPSEPAPSTAAS